MTNIPNPAREELLARARVTRSDLSADWDRKQAEADKAKRRWKIMDDMITAVEKMK